MPFETLNGTFDEPPFHIHCRSIVVPWIPGMVNDQRAKANAELLTRPPSQRRQADGRGFKSIPVPDKTA